jgi:mannose-6-phosphate isomerase-like protein (cupin superfamily)
MKSINLRNMPWKERKSPKGKFHILYRNVGYELRGDKHGPRFRSQPPFEFAELRIPPGAVNFPYHSHAAEWEFYHIVSGTGVMRAGKKRVKVAPGDCLMCPPGEPHQLINTGRKDLVYHVVANNSVADIWHYPDSGKWGFTVGGATFFKLTPVDAYFSGEE